MSLPVTDRELLELAAKAAGIGGGWIAYDQTKWLNPSGYYLEPHVRWNPLTDDGDALRLAVRLRLEIRFYEEEGDSGVVQVLAFGVSENPDEGWTFTEGLSGNRDRVEATRRAIVRAAAQIGSAMP